MKPSQNVHSVGLTLLAIAAPNLPPLPPPPPDPAETALTGAALLTPESAELLCRRSHRRSRLRAKYAATEEQTLTAIEYP
jgi:hypothetical protein